MTDENPTGAARNLAREENTSSLLMASPSFAAQLRLRHAQLGAVRDGTLLVDIEPMGRQGSA